MRLNSDDKRKRRKKQRPNKNGVCPRYANAKVRYKSRSVARYDKKMLEIAYPDDEFVIFKCDRGGGGGCGHVHIGRLTDEGEVEVVK